MIKKTVLANRRCITSLAAMRRSTWRWAEARTTSPPSSTTVSGKRNIAKMPQPWKDKTHRRQCIMSSYKKLTFKGSLRQVFICLRPRTPYPPLHTVYVYTVYLFTQRKVKGWGELNQREGQRGNSSQSWFESTNMTDCISSLWTLINTNAKSLYRSFF
jgi:hypothetical protein